MFYKAVQSGRYFNRDQKYTDIEWTSLAAVVDAFRKRIDDWYLEPIRRLHQQPDGGHLAFTAMALNCLMIDTLSQYEYGLPESDGARFKQFVVDYLTPYSGNLHSQIQYQRYDRNAHAMVTRTHRTVQDVLWVGFRCGILHEAHVAPYGGVRPAGQRLNQRASGYLKYAASGASCPSVIVNPWRLFKDIEKVFNRYLKRLKNRNAAHEPLRGKFRTKFSDSFGVDISGAVL